MKDVFHTLRFRLSVWYAVVLSLVVAAFGGLQYGLVRHQLLRHHDTALLEAASAVGTILSEEPSCEQLTDSQRRRLDQAGGLVLFHEVEGETRLLYRSPESATLPVPGERYALAGPAPGGARFETLSGEMELLRMYSRPYKSIGGCRGVIRVMHGLGNVLAPLASLRLSFLFMAPLAVLLSAGAGYWLAGRALAPVDQVTRTAREIEASGLSRRLPLPRGQDEMRRLVETFNQMIARLEASFEGMRRFTADAAHELRGPLATMRAAIDIALSRPREASAYRDALTSVGEDVDRLRSVAQDLLVLARADAGRINLERSPVRFDMAVAEVVESLQPLAQESGVSLHANTGSAVVLMGDERWLRQLVFNLVDNALKFSATRGDSAGSALVWVELGHAPGTARLDVADSGPGIPTEVLGRVFERFYRVDNARTGQRTEGSGLGLAIAAWVVEAHGGKIWAENRLEGGCNFSVTLPTAEGAPS